MRCHYLSDLHLESEVFESPLQKGDVLIIAGDLCHARCLDRTRTDKYSIGQRDRVDSFIDRARASFPQVLLIAGNHEHYDGVFEDTVGFLRRHLHGVTVLDDEAVEIGGVRFFGSTLWTDFDGRSEIALEGMRRRMGEYFFVRTRQGGDETLLTKFRPENALAAHDRAWLRLLAELQAANGKPMVAISHHAPSLQGLNPQFAGNGRDGAYASDLDERIASLEGIPVWVHGHTHIASKYRIGRTEVRSNARGFASKGQTPRGFNPGAWFEI
ncbi:MAG: hypothetical protein F9K44_09605 [Hyphomicrobiaceae bacterium]|nr:MAG: hypothetical protein F9K44_09605 [Hyphomicrobiaceae bacterium]